jgi:hypothetical protein
MASPSKDGASARQEIEAEIGAEGLRLFNEYSCAAIGANSASVVTAAALLLASAVAEAPEEERESARSTIERWVRQALDAAENCRDGDEIDLKFTF